MLNNYATRFTKDFIKSSDYDKLNNLAISPLGSWINLVIYAKSFEQEFTQDEKDSIEQALQSSIDKSFQKLQRILEKSPHLINIALAVWENPHTQSKLSNLILDTVKRLKGNTGIFSHIPTQKEIDTWVKVNSKEILTEFPEDVTSSDTDLIIANIIATKIEWDEAYDSIDNNQNMSHWNASKILTKKKNKNTEVFEYQGKYYGVHSNSHYDNKLNEHVSVYSIVGNDDNTDLELHNALRAYRDPHTIQVKRLNSDDFSHISEDFINVSYTTITTSDNSPQYNVQYPAWESSNDLDLGEYEGFLEVADMFKKNNLEIINKQVVKSLYNKKGYEAAALTYGMILRSAVIIKEPYKIAIVDVLFNKPFVSHTYLTNPNEPIDAPIFVTFVREATEVSE